MSLYDPEVMIWLVFLMYLVIIGFLIRCISDYRCFAPDEHAMIPGDKRLVDVRDGKQ